MSKKFKCVALSVLCVILIACAVAVGAILGLSGRNNIPSGKGVANSGNGGNSHTVTSNQLGTNNETAYVVALSGTAADMATQWKNAMGLNGTVTVVLESNWTASGSFGTCTGSEKGFGSTGGLVIPAGKTVVLNMNGFNINRGLTAATADGSVITVEATADLIINGAGDITGGYNSGLGGGIVSDGDLTINGATIKANKSSSPCGGVMINGTGVTLTMNSGEISGNQGGSNGGGVLLVNSANFTLAGGIIKNNTCGTSGGAGVQLYIGATMTMSGGVISGNTSGGSGGGIYLSNASTLTMTGGTVNGNTATSQGGGVMIGSADSTFNMSGGTISGNTAGTGVNGGGVQVSGGTFNLSGGTITGNICPGSCAVGVNSAGKVNMSGGSIVNNSSCSYGVGSAAAYTAEFSGGIISGQPNGVNMPTGSTLKVKGEIHITGNTTSNLILGSSVKAQITGVCQSPSTESQIGVTATNNSVFTQSYTTSGFTTSQRADRMFFADKTNQQVTFSGSELKMVSGTSSKVTWSANINGTPTAFNNYINCYYGDVISSVTATIGSQSGTWNAASGLNSTGEISSWGPDSTYTQIKKVATYSFWATGTLGGLSLPTNASSRAAYIEVRPRPITVTIDDKTSKFGESLETLTGTVTGGTLASGDTLASLGITYLKAKGDSVGKYPITATASNTNYDVTFVNGEYEITGSTVSIEINDQYAEYGSKYYTLTKTENNTKWAGVGAITNKNGQDYDSEDWPVDSNGDRIDDNGNVIYNGGWRYATGSDTFAASDLASSTRYPMTITCSGTGFTDISSTANANYIAAGQYFINYVANPNYTITFTSNGTNGASNNQGVFEIKGADITVESAAVYDSSNKYDSKDYTGSAISIAIPTTASTGKPTGAVKLKGDVASCTIKYRVFKSDDTSIPTTDPAADDATFWTSASTAPTQTAAGEYKVYSLIKADNHKDKVHIWTFKIGSLAQTYSFVVKHGGTAVAAGDGGVYKVTYDPNKEVEVTINFDDTSVTTTNCPIKVYYKGTDTGNTYGAAGDADFPDDSGNDSDNNPRNLGNSTKPKEAGTYTATVIPDPTATSGYSFDAGTVSFTIEAKKISLPTVTSTALTYNGSAQTIQYVSDTVAVKAITSTDTGSFTGLTETVNGENKTYKDLTYDSKNDNAATKQTTTSFKATDAGEYAVKFELSSTRNYAWDGAASGQETTAKIVSKKIDKKKLDFTFVSPVKKDGNEVWQWDASTTADDGITAKASSLTGLVSGDTVTFDVSWYKYANSAAGTLNSVQTNVDYSDIDVAISSFTEQASYFVLVQMSAGTTSNKNDNYCLSGDDTHFTPKLEGVKTREITVGAGKVDVSRIIWKWQLEDSGVDPAKYIKGSADPKDDTKLVYTKEKSGNTWTEKNYMITADLSDLSYLELDTTKGTNGYENDKYSAASAAGSPYKTKIYIKIKSGSSYEFTNDANTGYTYVSSTEATVEFEWVINKKEISFVDDSGESLVKWAYYLSKDNENPTSVTDPVWKDFSDKDTPTYTGKLIFVKISDSYFEGLGLDLNDVKVTYTSNSKAPANSEQTTKATVSLSGDTAKNFVLKDGKAPDFKWTIGNTKITVGGWDTDTGRELDDGKGHVFTLPGVAINAPDEATKKKLEGSIEYKYTYTYTDKDGVTHTKTDVSEAEMIADLFELADEKGTPINVDVKAVLTEEGKKTYDLTFDDGTPETFTSSIGDSKLKVHVSLDNTHSVYGSVDFGITAIYYFDNDETTTAQPFSGQFMSVEIYKDEKLLGTLALSDISDFAQYIKDAGEYKLVMKLDDSKKEDYKFAGSTLTFTVTAQEIEVPLIVGSIEFNGETLRLADYLDAKYKEYLDKGIISAIGGRADARDVSANGGYVATLTIIDPNYKWKLPSSATPSKILLKLQLAEDEISTNVTVDSTRLIAEYGWNVAPFKLTTDIVNTSGKDGASINVSKLPEWARNLITDGSLSAGVKYYVDENCTEEVAKDDNGNYVLAKKTQYYVKPFIGAGENGDDSGNFTFATDGTVTNTSAKAVTYKLPQTGMAAALGNIKGFVTKTWLGLPVWAWIAIGVAVLILLIIIIAVAVHRRKTKAIREEKKAAKQAAKEEAAAKAEAERARIEAEREAERMRLESQREIEKMKAEAEAAKAKAEAEAEIAKIRAQAQAQMQAMPQQMPMPQQAAMPQQMPVAQQMPMQQQYHQPMQQMMPQYPQQQMPQQMPVYGPMPQPVNNSELAELKAEFKAMRAEQRSDVKLENELLKLRLDVKGEGKASQYPQMPVFFPQGYPQQFASPQLETRAANAGDSLAEQFGIMMAAMMRNMSAPAPVAPAQPAEVKPEPQQVVKAETASVVQPAVYPPDAVITTTTTVDTTKATAKTQATPEDERDSRDRFFDIDGFYDKFEG